MKSMIYTLALVSLNLINITAYAEDIEISDTPQESKKSKQSVENRLYYVERKINDIKTATASMPSTEDFARLENKIDQLSSDILALNSDSKAMISDIENIDLSAPLAIEIAEVAHENQITSVAHNESHESKISQEKAESIA